MAAQWRRGNNSDGVEKWRRGTNFKRFDVEVGLIETVEQNHAAGTYIFKTRDEVGEAGEGLGELDGDRNFHRVADALDKLEKLQLDFVGGLAAVGGDGIGIELDGVGSGLIPFPWRSAPSRRRWFR